MTGVKGLLARCLLLSALAALGLQAAACGDGKNQWDGDLGTAGAGAPDTVTTTLASGESYIEASVWAPDVGRAYFGTRNPTPYHLIRFNPADNTYTAYESISPTRYCMAVEVAGGTVFVAHRGYAAASISTFATSASPPELIQTYNYGSYATASLATDGTYLFVGNAHSQILLVRISDMTLVDTLQLTTAVYGEVHALEYDSGSGLLFASIPYGYAGYTFKVHRSGDTLVKDAEYLTGHEITDDIVVAGGYLWLPVESWGGTILRVPLTGFDSYEEITFGPTSQGAMGVMLDSEGTHLLVISHDVSYNSQLSRLTLADLTYQRLWFADNELNVDDIIEYAPGKYLISTMGSPAQIINLTNPFPDGGVDKPTSGYDYTYWASLRPYAETTPGVSISDLKVYTDGSNGLGTGWSALGGIATDYAEPTGTEGVSGEVVSGSGVRVKP